MRPGSTQRKVSLAVDQEGERYRASQYRGDYLRFNGKWGGRQRNHALLLVELLHASRCVLLNGACADDKRDAGMPMAPFFMQSTGKQSPPQRMVGQEDLAVALCIPLRLSEEYRGSRCR